MPPCPYRFVRTALYPGRDSSTNRPITIDFFCLAGILSARSLSIPRSNRHLVTGKKLDVGPLACSKTESEMQTLMKFTRYEIEFLLGGLAAVVAFQIITRRINTKGLLSNKEKDGAEGFSPARLQLLMFTFGVAFYVLGKVLSSIAAGAAAFPNIDPNLLVVLGGSHALYLGAKALPTSGSKADNSNK